MTNDYLITTKCSCIVKCCCILKVRRQVRWGGWREARVIYVTIRLKVGVVCRSGQRDAARYDWTARAASRTDGRVYDLVEISICDDVAAAAVNDVTWRHDCWMMHATTNTAPCNHSSAQSLTQLSHSSVSITAQCHRRRHSYHLMTSHFTHWPSNGYDCTG